MAHPASTYSVGIERLDAITALGDAADTAAALASGTRALRPAPLLGEDGGEEVPMALLQPLDVQASPRWMQTLLDFAEPVGGPAWGTARQPVIVTSSNYGVEAMYGYRTREDHAFVPWSTAHGCTRLISDALGWGPNIQLLSHACVTAQLGLLQAARLLEQDLADRVLIFSFDFLSPFVAGGFHALKILNGQMPAPYADAAVGAIGLGDGAAYAVVRRDPGIVNIRAQHVYNEMHHFTANRDDGSGFEALLAPLAHFAKGRKLWIKGHGTGTLEAGRLESRACARHFPGAPLVSWKGSIGHTLGSCALVELAIAQAAHQQGRIPGTIGSTEPCFSTNVALAAFDADAYDAALHLSNAFGGAHAAMLVDHA